MDQMVQYMQKMDEHMASLEKRLVRKPMSELTCHLCNKLGHIRPYCPDNPNRRTPGQSQNRSQQNAQQEYEGLPRTGYQQVRFEASHRQDAPPPPRWPEPRGYQGYQPQMQVSAVDDWMETGDPRTLNEQRAAS